MPASSHKEALILSLFPGIDLLGKGFVQEGYTVVRGPDAITGDDNRDFNPRAGWFDGVIGGPPCQDFSTLNRSPGTYSLEMTEDYKRVVRAAAPGFYLYENVAAAPPVDIEGYVSQRFALDLAWFTPFTRLRYFVFGSKSGALLNPLVGSRDVTVGGAVTGSDDRPFSVCCEIQGLPADFDIPFFNAQGKLQAVANGVPLPLARYVAQLIKRDYYRENPGEINVTSRDYRRCACGCGRIVLGRAKTASAACRKRLSRARQRP